MPFYILNTYKRILIAAYIYNRRSIFWWSHLFDILIISSSMQNPLWNNILMCNFSCKWHAMNFFLSNVSHAITCKYLHNRYIYVYILYLFDKYMYSYIEWRISNKHLIKSHLPEFCPEYIESKANSTMKNHNIIHVQYN